MSNIGVFRSISQVGRYEPFDLQVARGQISGHSVLNIYGYQPAVNNTYIPLWENATAYTYPVAAAKMHLASSNAGDTATIQINGLDASYNQISETKALTGTTAVTTTNSYLRINSMQVTVGSLTNPAGTVTLKDLTDTTTYAQINPGIGRTQMAIYTVPAGYTFYLSRVDANTSLNGNNANYMTYRNYSISPSGVVTVTQQAPFTQLYHTQRVMARPFSEKTDIQIQMANSAAANAAANVGVEGYLIANAMTGTTG